MGYHRIVSLLDQLHVTSEPAVDLESVGSTDPMIIDSDTASLDALPTNVVIYDEPPPHEHSGRSTVTEVLVINSGEHSDGGARDPLDAALWDLSAPIPRDADAETLEAHRVQLIKSVNRLASMRCLLEAYRREMDRAVGGAQTPEGRSHIGSIRPAGQRFLLPDRRSEAQSMQRDDLGKETERPWNANLLRRFYS